MGCPPDVWGWVPDEVKYYVARVGQEVAITMRNYQRQIGVLLGTHWDILEIEMGVLEKVYDTRDGAYYFERKIIRSKLGGVIDVQWIKDRKTEDEYLAESEKAGGLEEKTDKQTDIS